MGETICRHCRHMNWHIKAHATGKCELCGRHIFWCDSCMTTISPTGEKWARDMINHRFSNIEIKLVNPNGHKKIQRI